MTTPMFTKLVTPAGVLLYGAQGGTVTPFQVRNTDVAHTLWVGNVSNVSTDGSNSIPLLPGDTASFDGSISVYGITATGIQVIAAIIPGGTSFSPGSVDITGPVTATISGPVSITGPVTIGNSFILPGAIGTLQQDASAHAITPGTAFTYPIVNVQNYAAVNIDITLQSSNQATVGAALAAPVTLLWYDDALANNLVFAETVWGYVWNGSGLSGPQLRGVSPCHGQYLVIMVENPGTASNVSSEFLVVDGTYRTPVTSSWRQFPIASQLTCTGATVTSLDFPPSAIAVALLGFHPDLYLGGLHAVSLATGVKLFPMPLYSGPVVITYGIGANVLIAAPTIVNLALATSGNLVAGNSQPGLVWIGANAANVTTSPYTVLNFPRAPCALVLDPNASGSVVIYSAIGQQGY